MEPSSGVRSTTKRFVLSTLTIRATYADLRRDEETQIEVRPDGIHNVHGWTVWRFAEIPGGWEVALTPEFVALATTRYTDREDFLGRLTQLLAALDDWLQPAKIRRLGVRYIDRVHDHHLERLSQLLRPEVLGPYNVDRPDGVSLCNALTDCDYRFDDETALHARWGFLAPNTTFDPAIAPVSGSSWVLDLDASHGERDFDPDAICQQAQIFTDRIYRYFRWAVTDDFLTAYGAD